MIELFHPSNNTAIDTGLAVVTHVTISILVCRDAATLYGCARKPKACERRYASCGELRALQKQIKELQEAALIICHRTDTTTDQHFHRSHSLMIKVVDSEKGMVPQSGRVIDTITLTLFKDATEAEMHSARESIERRFPQIPVHLKKDETIRVYTPFIYCPARLRPTMP